MSPTTPGRTWDESLSPAAVRLARRFEDAWRGAGSPARRPDPSDFLADASACPGARLALWRSEMNLRWEAGDKVGAGWFRTRCDDLDEPTLVALIYEEFCLHEEHEPADPPHPEDYLDRYFEVAPALRRVLDIHGLVGSGTATALEDVSPPATPFPAAGETIAGFRLVEELGRGAFARVFLARERQLADRPVALKVTRTGSPEPQALARLQHTHIVPVYSCRTDPATGLHLLCMPYFGRVTLAQVLADSRVRVARSGAELVEAVDRLGGTATAPGGRSAGRAALSRRGYARAIAWWGARMAEALEHAHDRGILHRDVKPSNVLVTADGMPMLLDFNLAREVVLNEGAGERAVPGGTLDYMAPEHLDEVAEGRTDRFDARSDVYGLGVLLYEALAGARPFPSPRGAASATELLRLAARDRREGAPRLRAARPEVPAALDAVVARCLDPDPGCRYASAADLAADLQAVADDSPLVHASEPLRARASRWLRRHRRVLATSLPVVMAMIGVLTLEAQRRVEQDRNRGKVLRLYNEGLASEAEGDLARAMLQYDTAVRMADKPEAGGPPPSLLTGGWAGVDELRQMARFRYRDAERSGKVRAAADAFSSSADMLRFRLTEPEIHLRATSERLVSALSAFHVFEVDDWRTWPDVALLDAARAARLRRDVDELLFLWADALAREGRHDQSLRREALKICGLALRESSAGGPWRALRGRIAADLNGEDAPDVVAPPPSEGSTASVNFEWGVLLLGQGRKADAVACLARAVRLDEASYVYHNVLASALDDPHGLALSALRHHDAAVALCPHSVWARFTRARCYRLGGDNDLAREDFQRALVDYRALPAFDRVPEFDRIIRRELDLSN